MKPRKLPPVRKVRTRKGNHPANPYADKAKTAAPLEPRRGPPPPIANLSTEPPLPYRDLHAEAQRIQPLDLSDEAQLGPSRDAEPAFWIPASDPYSGILLRFWANVRKAAGSIHPADFAAAHALAAEMDAWRNRNSGAGRAGTG